MSEEAKKKLQERLKFKEFERKNLATRNNKMSELKKQLKKTDSSEQKAKIKQMLKMLDEIDQKEVDATLKGGEGIDFS